MVEGKLQVQGEVIHLLVQQCFDFSKLLRKLTPSNAETPQVLTLARPDETSIPARAQNKRSEVREDVGEKIFPEGRNFR